jgi:hypothetical protein
MTIVDGIKLGIGLIIVTVAIQATLVIGGLLLGLLGVGQ